MTNRSELAIDEFKNQVQDLFNGKIDRMYLYGSYVRGEQGEDSDIDILVITKDGDPGYQRRMSFLAADVNLKYGVEISVEQFTLDHFDQYHDFSFFTNVQTEGILIG